MRLAIIAATLETLTQISELDSAVLAYLVARGLTRSVKAFEGETKCKITEAGKLESAWLTGSSTASVLSSGATGICLII